jgi:hypothetical protein
MLRIKKLIHAVLALFITLSLTACESVPAAADTPLDEIEYKTIEPPEDGWTLELLNEVTYINGKNVKFPFCVNDLGADFSYKSSVYNDDNRQNTGYLFYKDKSFSIIDYVIPQNKDYSDDLRILGFSYPASLENTFLAYDDFHIVNGITYGSSFEELLNSFGKNYKLINKSGYAYYFSDTEGAVMFGIDNSENTINLITIWVENKE